MHHPSIRCFSSGINSIFTRVCSHPESMRAVTSSLPIFTLLLTTWALALPCWSFPSHMLCICSPLLHCPHPLSLLLVLEGASLELMRVRCISRDTILQNALCGHSRSRLPCFYWGGGGVGVVSSFPHLDTPSFWFFPYPAIDSVHLSPPLHFTLLPLLAVTKSSANLTAYFKVVGQCLLTHSVVALPKLQMNCSSTICSTTPSAVLASGQSHFWALFWSI